MAIYVKRYDKNAKYWMNNAEYNQYFIRMMINHFNTLLKTRGYVFLKDIYEYLGMPITRDSIIVGWIDSPTKYVDIVYEQASDTEFMLKFRTDGIILTCFN